MVLEADYVLTLGRKLVGLENINTFPGRLACPTATYAPGSLCYNAGYPAGFSTSRLSHAFGSDNFRTNGFSSNYSGGQLSIRKGYSNGLQVTANYTYSKAMDEVSDVFTIKSGATGISAPYNPSYDYGPADFDTKHLFVLTANYVSHSQSHKLLLAGWGLSPIITLHSGTPIDIIDGSSGYSPNKDGVAGVQRAVYTGTDAIKNAINHSQSPATGYLKPGSFGAYTCPLTVNAGLFCNPPVQRNSLYGPSFYNVDLAGSKHFTFRDHYEFTFQAAFFDLDNHPEFVNPVANTNEGNFGQSTSTFLNGNRVGQLSGTVRLLGHDPMLEKASLTDAFSFVGRQDMRHLAVEVALGDKRGDAIGQKIRAGIAVAEALAEAGGRDIFGDAGEDVDAGALCRGEGERGEVGFGEGIAGAG